MNNATSRTSHRTEIIGEALPRLIEGENFVNDFLARPVNASDRDWVKSFVRSHWGSEIIVAKGRVIRAAELDGFAALQGEKPIGLLTYRTEGPNCESLPLTAPFKAGE